MPADNQRLLSPEEVARHCGLSRRAVYDAIRRGELQAMRLCNRLRIRHQDFERWLEASTVTPASPLPVMNLSKLTPRPAVAGSFKALMDEGQRRAA